MPVLNSGVRIGAAAVVVGLSLAGPQALGVAAADSSEVDSTSVSAGPADPGAVSGDEGSPARPGAGRGGRGVAPNGSIGSRVGSRASADVTSAQQTPAVEVARRSVRGSVSVRPVAAVADRRHSVAVTPPGFGASVPSVPDVVSGVAEVAVAVPSAAAVVADAARVPGRAERGAAVRVAVQPATPPVMQALNTAITNLFDSTATWLSDLPASPARDLISGALLLVRRTLFNQLPIARPCGCGPLETSSGQYVGTVGAVDPEDGALIYSLAEAPQYGTVQITADGVYTYTPGVDFAGIDKFTVAVTDPGFNLLQPFSSRQLLVPVDVPGAGGCSAERSSAARCSAGYRPPTEIAPDFDAEKYAWYEVLDGERVLGPVLEGTDGAVMWHAIEEERRGVPNVTSDGVQGMITNKTGTPIVVQSNNMSTRTAMAILLPNEWMPYRLNGYADSTAAPNRGGTLQFYPIDLGSYDPTTLPVRPQTGFADVKLVDPFTFWSEPYVRFSANGVGDGVKYEFSEGAIVNFAAQGIQIWVRRQHDGWRVPAFQAYLHRYFDPNTWHSNDYAIFNIDVKSL